MEARVEIIFFIHIVLLNLLVGLAVTEITEVRSNAYTIYQKSRLDLISYIEAMFFGDPYSFLTDYPPFKWIQHCYPCDFIFKHCGLLQKRLSSIGTHYLLFYKKNYTIYTKDRTSDEVKWSASNLLVEMRSQKATTTE